MAAYAGIGMIVISDCFCRRGEVRHGRHMGLEILQSVRQSDTGRSGGRTLRIRGPEVPEIQRSGIDESAIVKICEYKFSKEPKASSGCL